MRRTTYGEYSQKELGLDEEAWGTLQDYVATITDALEAEVTSGRGITAVEENPPQISADEFSPGGWVGLYPGDITVVPDHLSDDEYETLLDETQRWIEIIGANTIATALPLSSDILIDSRAKLATYSKALIDLTETVQAHRLPVEVRRTRRRGLAPEGRPLFEETVRESAQGSQQIVSEEVTFTFDTLLNHLLVRFHIELLSEMRELAAEYTYYRTAFTPQIDYHDDFVNSGIPSNLIDQAIDTDFAAPSVIDEARREAAGDMAKIVDLWEAFQRGQSMELVLSNRLNSAVKPMSKLYELWCLGLLLTALEGITGRQPENRTDIDRGYQFGSRFTLYYNKRFRTASKYLKPNFGVTPGEPDFAIEVDGDIVWIGDAKFKTDVKLADYQRFLTYLLDLLPPDQESAILYLGSGIPAKKVRDYTIKHLPLRPGHADRMEQEINKVIGKF